MQEIRLNFTLHDIREGDEPPEDGYYLVVEPKIDMVSVVTERMWWDSKHHGWRLYKESESLFVPIEYYGMNWTTDFLTELLEAEK